MKLNKKNFKQSNTHKQMINSIIQSGWAYHMKIQVKHELWWTKCELVWLLKLSLPLSYLTVAIHPGPPDSSDHQDPAL